MRPKYSFFIISLILTLIITTAPAFSIAQTIDDPSNIEKLTMKIIQTGTITVTKGDLEWMKINITLPADNKDQTMTTTEKYITDPAGNNILEIRKDYPENIIQYEIETTVTTTRISTTDLPDSYTIPEDIKQYLEPTENIQSNSTEIASLAEDIIKGKETDFEKIAAIATWVYNNIDYQIEYGTTSKDALWTLNNRKGTCDEFATLFIAMARSQGYPARYISGYAYGNGGWEKHAFSEVYLGEWVPVDPTWNEVGYLDATHIRYATKQDNIVKNEVQAYGRDIGQIAWIEDDTDIIITSIDEKDKQDYEFRKSSNRLEMGEDAIILLRFTPDEYKTVNVDLEPCITRDPTKPIVTIDNQKQTIILSPGEERIIYWKAEVSDSLKRNMEYTCPLTMNSRDLALQSIDLVVNTAEKTTEQATILTELEKDELIFGEPQKLTITIQKTTGPDPITIGIIAGDEFFERTFTRGIGIVETAEFRFTPKKSGTNELIIYSSTGMTRTMTYEVKKAGDIYIEDIEYPEYAEIGTPIEITTTIRNNMTTSGNIRLEATLGSQVDYKTEIINKETAITSTFIPDTEGDTKFTVRVTGPNTDTRTSRTITVYKIPEISTETEYDYETQKATIRITTRSGEAENIRVTINSQTKNLEGGSNLVEFDLPTGTHKTTITFDDIAGNTHKTEATITIEEQSLIEKIIAFLKRLFG